MSRRIIIYCVMDAKCFQHPPWPCVGQSRAEISSFPGGCTHSPGVLFALPAVAGTVLTMGSIRDKSPVSGLCVLERTERSIFIFLPSLAKELIQSFLTYPRVKAIEKTTFSKAPSTLLSL